MNTDKNTNNDNPFANSLLDEMLREWHDQNTEAAQGSRDALAQRLAKESEGSAPIASIGVSSTEKDALTFRPAKRRMTSTRWALPMAAVLALVGAAAIWFGPSLASKPSERVSSSAARYGLGTDHAVWMDAPAVNNSSLLEEHSPLTARAESDIPARLINAAYSPIAGRLDAIDDAGNEIGDCPLEHTEVNVDIAGRFARVSLTQHYYNTFADKIEAVYTFPMSQDAAVDAMKITVGDRVIEAEIEERERARRIYEAARARGNVAALLEQDRPNIFTQSVANIEPGERVSVHISYTELVSETDGERSFDFPMAVAPRYTPGNEQPMPGADSPKAARPGEPFAEPTNQVPDADIVTPMPNHPNVRAGHDISINVSINTGGPALLGIDSGSHMIDITNDAHGFDEPRSRAELSLASFTEIPNKDFVLTWRQESDFIEPSVFTHTNTLGSFVTLVLEPPARVEDAIATPKELVFVLDSSASMNGQPIEKAKQVIDESLRALRPQDTFNIITFAGSTRILWDAPMPGTPANITTAREFVAGQRGKGGTEMMHAINKALIQPDETFKHALTTEDLASTPADGRRVIVQVGFGAPRETDPVTGHVTLHLPNGRTVETSEWVWQTNQSIHCPVGVPVYLTGRWVIEDARHVLKIEAARHAKPARPLRIVAFLTDGQVSNDQAIIDAVRRNAQTTRVFSFGVGSSPNRYLLDSMAKASKGEAEYVGLESDATEKATMFAQRISTPVLRDVTLTLPANLAGAALSSPDLFDEPRLIRTSSNGDRVFALPDLFDAKPITIHARLDKPASGAPLFRGFSPLGEYRSGLSVPVAQQEAQPQLPILWARAEVEHTMNQDLAAVQRGDISNDRRDRVVELGKAFSIMTRYTSFVAVDRARVTIGGQPRLVRVPIEMPNGMNYWNVFTRMPRKTQGWLMTSLGQNAQIYTSQVIPNERGAVIRQLANLEESAAMKGERAQPISGNKLVQSAPAQRENSPRASGAFDEQSNQAVASRPATFQLDATGTRRIRDAEELRSLLGNIPVTKSMPAHMVKDDEIEDDSEPESSPAPSLEAYAPSEEIREDDELYPSYKRVRLFVTKVDLDLLNEIASGERGSPIRVSILMSEITEESLRALAEAGATIEGRSKSASIVIASVMPGGFDALVHLETVLRIEPASIKPEA